MQNELAAVLNIRPEMSIIRIYTNQIQTIGRFVYFPFSDKSPIAPQPEVIYLFDNDTEQYEFLDCTPDNVKRLINEHLKCNIDTCRWVQSDD